MRRGSRTLRLRPALILFCTRAHPSSPRRKQSALEIKNREEAAQRAAAIEAAEPEDASAASHYLSNREALRAAKAVEHELLQSEAASAIQRRVRQRTQRRLGVV